MGRERDAEMIMNPDRWPHWPYLPLIQTSFDPNSSLDEGVGVLVDGPGCHPGGHYVVLLTNLYLLKHPARRKVYGSVQELLDDGWRVD